MGWKNIKDHYRITHIVQVREGVIAIGSPYVPDLIRVTMKGGISWGNLGPSSNDDLARYFSEMVDDTDKVSELIEAPDSFSRSLPVYTYRGGEILEKQCEEYGYPNVTHDGEVQYDNSFSQDKNQVVEWAKRAAGATIVAAERRLSDLAVEVASIKAWRQEGIAARKKLEMDYPTPNEQPSPQRN